MAIIHAEGDYSCTSSDPNSMDKVIAIICTEGEYICTGCDTKRVDKATVVVHQKGEWRGPMFLMYMKGMWIASLLFPIPR